MKLCSYTQGNLPFPPVWLLGPEIKMYCQKVKPVHGSVCNCALCQVSYCFLLATFIQSLVQRQGYSAANEFKLWGISYTQT